MDSLVNFDSQLEDLKNRRKEAIIKAFEGRTQQYVAKNTNIDATKLNKWISGIGNLEETEVTELEKFLGVDLK